MGTLVWPSGTCSHQMVIKRFSLHRFSTYICAWNYKKWAFFNMSAISHQISHPPAPIVPAGTFHLEVLNFVVCSDVLHCVCVGEGILAGRAYLCTTFNLTHEASTAEYLTAVWWVVLVCITHRKLAKQAQQSIRWTVNELMLISTRSTLHSIGKEINIVW